MGTTQLEIRLARRSAEKIACRYLIEQTYGRHYDIVFSKTHIDLNQKIEPYPNHYVMGLVDGELVACAGLYTENTYVQRYGDVGEADIARTLAAAGHPERIDWPRREYTKLVVRDGWNGMGLGRFFFAATHSRDFICPGEDRPPVLLACAKLSVFRNLYDASRLRTRTIKPFPRYKVHELYSSEEDPMESRLLLPDVDIDPRWYNLKIPGTYEIETPVMHSIDAERRLGAGDGAGGSNAAIGRSAALDEPRVIM